MQDFKYKDSLKRMNLQISAYRSSKLELNQLIRDLEFLNNSLRNYIDFIREKIDKEIEDIELIYALSLDRHNGFLTENDSHEINLILQKITDLINKYLEL